MRRGRHTICRRPSDRCLDVWDGRVLGARFSMTSTASHGAMPWSASSSAHTTRHGIGGEETSRAGRPCPQALGWKWGHSRGRVDYPSVPLSGTQPTRLVFHTDAVNTVRQGPKGGTAKLRGNPSAMELRRSGRATSSRGTPSCSKSVLLPFGRSARWRPSGIPTA